MRLVAWTSMLVPLLAIGACASAPETATPPPPPAIGTVTFPSQAWAGSTVLVQSASFGGRTDSAWLLIAADTVALARVNDTTFSAQLPTTLNGAVIPQLQLGSQLRMLGAVTIYGYADVRAYNTQGNPTTVAHVLVWPRDGHANVTTNGCIGNPCTGFGVLFYNLESGTVTSFPFNLELNQIGVTYQDSLFLFNDANRVVTRWRLLPTPTLVDTAPFSSGLRNIMQMSQTVALIDEETGVQAMTPSLAPLGYAPADHPQGMYMSPRGDRATIVAGGFRAGVPVFDAATGAVAYSVDQIQATGIDFSPDGALLAMAGGTTEAYYGSSRILLLQASTGAVLGDTTVDQPAFAVALDPSRPLLYVGVYGTDGRPSVLVFNRNTFGLLGQLHPPLNAPTCSCYGSIVLNSQNELYVFVLDPTQAYRFTLMPGSGIPGQ